MATTYEVAEMLDDNDSEFGKSYQKVGKNWWEILLILVEGRCSCDIPVQYDEDQPSDYLKL